jgi:hypothetical protein
VPNTEINQIDSTQYKTAFRPTKITIRKKNSLTLGTLKVWSNSKVCKFHLRQMQCKPFLSPPRICRFFTKQMVMWPTSPTFGASSLNKWKVGPTCEQYFVQSPRTLKHKILKEKKTMQGTNRQWQRYLCAFGTLLFFCNCDQWVWSGHLWNLAISLGSTLGQRSLGSMSHNDHCVYTIVTHIMVIS